MNDQLLWFATRGAGIVSLLFTTGVMYLGILSVLRWKTPAWPPFATAGFHKNLSLLSVVFLAIHIVTAVIDPFTSLGWLAALVPFSSSYRTVWLGLGVLSVDVTAALIVTSLLRGQIGVKTWRAIHWLAYAAWPMAVLHSIGTGSDAGSPWMTALTLSCVFAVGAAAVVRFTSGRPNPARKTPPKPVGEPSARPAQRVDGSNPARLAR